jgi:hypothetical protein
MKSIRELGTNKLAWEQTGPLASRLTTGDDVVGWLRWSKASGSLAEGESSEGKWMLKRTGILHPKVTVRRADSEENIAVMTMGLTGGGNLKFSDGSEYQLSPSRLWHSEWNLLDSHGTRLLTLKPELGWKKAAALVDIYQGALQIGNLSLLALVSWYVALLSSYDYSGGETAAVLAAVGI